jgi:putative ABC transport system permease protein
LLNKLVLENLKHRPVRTLLSVLAIGVEVTMILTLVGVSQGTLHETARRAKGVGADIIVRPPGSSILSLSSAPMQEKFLDFFEKDPRVAVASGATVNSLGGFDTMTGLDLARFTRMSGGFRYLAGGPFAGPDDILVDEYYARQKKLNVGDRIELMNHNWRVAGIVESGKLGRIFCQLPVLQELTGNTGKLSQIYLKLRDESQAAAMVEELRQRMPGYQIYTMEEFTSLLNVSNVGMLREFIYVVIGVAVVVGFIVVFLAMYTAVLERTREIGILKALGASPGFVLAILVRETLVLAALGSVVGVGLSFGTRWVLRAAAPSTLVQEIVPEWWGYAALIAVAGALLGAIYPGWKAARQDAIEALSYE